MIPEIGKNYTVQPGDNLQSIAKKAYGDEANWTTIFNANVFLTFQLATSVKLIPGDTLYIPDLKSIKEQTQEKFNSLQKTLKIEKDELAIWILINRNFYRIRPTSVRIYRLLDAVGDGWTALLPIDDTNTDLPDFLPGGFHISYLQIGQELILAGYTPGMGISVNSTGKMKTLRGFSFSFQALRTNLARSFEVTSQSFRQRAQELAQQIGIAAIFDETVEEIIIPRITAAENDTIASHLSLFALQYRILMSSTPQGDLFFTRPTSQGETISVFEEGVKPVTDITVDFRGEDLASAYKGGGSYSALWTSDPKRGVAKIDFVPRNLIRNIMIDEIQAQNIEQTMRWIRNQAIANAVNIQVTVASWTDDNDRPWQINKLVRLNAPTAKIDNFLFLIKRIEYNLEPASKQAILSLVDPKVYSEKDVQLPWPVL